MFAKPTWVLPAAMVLLVALGSLLPTARGDVIFEESFDTYPTGGPPVPPWYEDYTDLDATHYERSAAATHNVSQYVSNTHSVSSPNSMHFDDESFYTDSPPGVGSHLGYNFSPATAVTLEFYMLTEREHPEYEGAEVRLIGDGGQKESGIWFACGLFGHTDPGWIGVEQSHPTQGRIWTPVMEYDADIWYYVRREVDLVAGSGSVYVEQADNPSNNALVDLPPTGNVTYVDEIRILSSNSGRTDCYVDDIRVTPEPAAFSLLALGGLLLAGRRP